MASLSFWNKIPQAKSNPNEDTVEDEKNFLPQTLEPEGATCMIKLEPEAKRWTCQGPSKGSPIDSEGPPLLFRGKAHSDPPPLSPSIAETEGPSMSKRRSVSKSDSERAGTGIEMILTPTLVQILKPYEVKKLPSFETSLAVTPPSSASTRRLSAPTLLKLEGLSQISTSIADACKGDEKEDADVNVLREQRRSFPPTVRR